MGKQGLKRTGKKGEAQTNKSWKEKRERGGRLEDKRRLAGGALLNFLSFFVESFVSDRK